MYIENNKNNTIVPLVFSWEFTRELFLILCIGWLCPCPMTTAAHHLAGAWVPGWGKAGPRASEGGAHVQQATREGRASCPPGSGPQRIPAETATPLGIAHLSRRRRRCLTDSTSPSLVRLGGWQKGELNSWQLVGCALAAKSLCGVPGTPAIVPVSARE